jgi:hypothetical protein
MTGDSHPFSRWPFVGFFEQARVLCEHVHTGVEGLKIGFRRSLACLVAGLACTSNGAAAPRVSASPEVHYTMTTHRFAVADPHRNPDEISMARDVEWSYPVFSDTHDPATRGLNAWARHESLKLLLLEVDDADRLTDAQVVAKAIASQDFLDSGIDQAVVLPDAALGRYRGVTDVSESTGGTHPVHGTSVHLYSLDSRAEVDVASLFKPDDDGVLEELFEAQPEAACPDASFDWAQARLSSIDTLAFEYPYRPGRNLKDVDCSMLVIQSPKVTQLLKSPSSLHPRYRLVDDTRRRPAVTAPNTSPMTAPTTPTPPNGSTG